MIDPHARPTPKQLYVLRCFRLDGPFAITRAEASRLLLLLARAGWRRSSLVLWP